VQEAGDTPVIRLPILLALILVACIGLAIVGCAKPGDGQNTRVDPKAFGFWP
jgi:hypothetical protein